MADEQASSWSRFIESAVLWGGIGVILGAITSSIAKSWLMIVGCVFILIAVVRAGFFPEMVRWRRYVANSFICASIGVLLICLWYKLPKPAEALTYSEAQKMFSGLNSHPPESTTPQPQAGDKPITTAQLQTLLRQYANMNRIPPSQISKQPSPSQQELQENNELIQQAKGLQQQFIDAIDALLKAGRGHPYMWLDDQTLPKDVRDSREAELANERQTAATKYHETLTRLGSQAESLQRQIQIRLSDKEIADEFLTWRDAFSTLVRGQTGGFDTNKAGKYIVQYAEELPH